MTDKTGAVQVDTDKLADLAPKLTALLPQTIASMKASRDLSLASYNSQKALLDQLEAAQRHRPRDGRGASTRRRTTTCSFCPRRLSTTPTSSAG